MPEDGHSRHTGPARIAEGIFRVGFYDSEDMLACNPYLVVAGDEAVLIDGGNRPDFSDVMLSILQCGIRPGQIKHLIYHHYDPDLCGSAPHLQEVIGTGSLDIISHRLNNAFIRYYGTSLPRICIESLHNELVFAGRKLRFIRTPYAHTAGSFVTFDEHTGTLFSSDLFGSTNPCPDIALKLPGQCSNCRVEDSCPHLAAPCPVRQILDFNAALMPSAAALRYALHEIGRLPILQIAPQHGGVISGTADIALIINKLSRLEKVGIDQFALPGPANRETTSQ